MFAAHTAGDQSLSLVKTKRLRRITAQNVLSRVCGFTTHSVFNPVLMWVEVCQVSTLSFQADYLMLFPVVKSHIKSREKWGVPCPRRPPDSASLAVPKPNSRQTTVADRRLQLSSHMVPHSPFFRTSTRPSPTMAPPRRRTNGCWGWRSRLLGKKQLNRMFRSSHFLKWQTWLELSLGGKRKPSQQPGRLRV